MFCQQLSLLEQMMEKNFFSAHFLLRVDGIMVLVIGITLMVTTLTIHHLKTPLLWKVLW